jgi:hypothetical protein
MSDKESSKSWGSTVIIYIIILVLVIITIVAIYYIFLIPSPPQFPVSPFDYGDIVEISPAVLSQDNLNFKIPQQNQYLTRIISGSNCLRPNDGNAQPETCVPIFTGNQEDNSSRWILRNSYDSTANCGDPSKCIPFFPCANCPNFLAKQNFTEFGNRFYLQNATAASTGDVSALMTYFYLNGELITYNPSVTFPLTGNNNIPSDNLLRRYDNPFIVYFFPTTQPDLYYILFPGNNSNTNPNSLSPNDSILSLRPFAQPNDNTYNPWGSDSKLNPNSLLLNSLSDSFVSVNGTALGTNRPNLFLFKIIKVGSTQS